MSAGILDLAVEVWNYEFNEILIFMCSFEFESSIIQISDGGLCLDAMEESTSFLCKDLIYLSRFDFVSCLKAYITPTLGMS